MNLNNDEIKIYDAYMNYLANRVNNPLGIDGVIKELGLDYSMFFKCLVNYINRNVIKPKYAIILDTLFEMIIYNNNVDFNTFLSNENVTYEELQTNLDNYLTYFRPDIKYTNEYLPKLNAILERYREYCNKLKEKNKQFSDKLITANKLITDFINCPYSLERFLLPKRIKLSKFLDYVNFVKRYNPELYQQYEENISLKENIKQKSIKKDVLSILNLIKELGNDFTGIDLFKSTLYGPRELVKEADSILEIEDLKLFRCLVNKYNTAMFLSNIISSTLVSELVQSKLAFTIDSEIVETKEEERQMIIDDLISNSIPITSGLFVDDYKKYYHEKKKVLKHS